MGFRDVFFFKVSMRSTKNSISEEGWGKEEVGKEQLKDKDPKKNGSVYLCLKFGHIQMRSRIHVVNGLLTCKEEK